MKLFYFPFVCTLVFFLFFQTVTGQGQFHFIDNKEKLQISFINKNNLIILPIEVNGKALNFILDTGVSRTILFNLNQVDSLDLKEVKKIKIKGLGSNKPVDALLSKNNNFRIKNIVGRNQNLYFILDSDFDLSAKLGLTIHGIIGYDLVKDFVVEINYSQKRITFYNPKKYKKKRLRKFEKFDLTFYNNKPYIHTYIQFKKEEAPVLVKLLVDSGGSDALWIFEGSHEKIVSPEKYFDDYLGEGLSGIINGKRSKVYNLLLGKYNLKGTTVSYPDSSAIVIARKQLDRNGSIGGTVLGRFRLILDYQNAALYLKKGGKYDKPFNYNMSGIELVYSGQVLVKERQAAINSNTYNSSTNRGVEVLLDYNYNFIFKPSYSIFSIRKNSPAYIAGLRKGDIILSVNNKAAHQLKLEEIIHGFYSKPNRKYKIRISRYGIEQVYSFRLKKVI
ncbi:MAG: hypothetical protein COB60_02170 [Flavobacteriaceae bacterium]|nr:MAG: hypothetical protein COB60_02170 [Flavobacteriaceae bacterium]